MSTAFTLTPLSLRPRPLNRSGITIFKTVEEFDHIPTFLAGMEALARLLKFSADHNQPCRVITTKFLLDVNFMGPPIPISHFRALDANTYLDVQDVMSLSYLLEMSMHKVFPGLSEELLRLKAKWDC